MTIIKNNPFISILFPIRISAILLKKQQKIPKENENLYGNLCLATFNET